MFEVSFAIYLNLFQPVWKTLIACVEMFIARVGIFIACVVMFIACGVIFIALGKNLIARGEILMVFNLPFHVTFVGGKI